MDVLSTGYVFPNVGSRIFLSAFFLRYSEATVNATSVIATYQGRTYTDVVRMTLTSNVITEGDSGGLVYAEETSNNLRAAGIILGRNPQNNSIGYYSKAANVSYKLGVVRYWTFF